MDLAFPKVTTERRQELQAVRQLLGDDTKPAENRR
jgi:hypothetical protein